MYFDFEGSHVHFNQELAKVCCKSLLYYITVNLFGFRDKIISNQGLYAYWSDSKFFAGLRRDL